MWRAFWSLVAVPALAGKWKNVVYKRPGGVSLKLDLWTPPNYPCHFIGNQTTKASEVSEAMPADDPYPLVVYLYGGAYKTGRKEGVCGSFGCPAQVPDVAKKNKFATLSLNYRLDTEHFPPGTYNTWPTPFQDVVDAIKYVLKDKEKYHIDADRIACYGESAGAHLCALLGSFTAWSAAGGGFGTSEGVGGPPVCTTEPCIDGTVAAKPDFTIKAVAVNFPPTDILDLQPDFAAQGPFCQSSAGDNDLASSITSHMICNSGYKACGVGIGAIRKNPSKYPALYNRTVSANPFPYITKASMKFLPELFVRAGTCDILVPHKQGQRLVDAYKAVGKDIDAKFIKGASHMCQPFPLWTSSLTDQKAWIAKQLSEASFMQTLV